MKRSAVKALLCWTAVCGLAVSVKGQTAGPGPIRVESNEVLIPVLVLDKARLTQAQGNPDMLWAQAESGDFRSWGTIPVRNLTAKDFEVFEDGERQTIERVTPENQADPDVKDNIDEYYRYVGPGKGIWIRSITPVLQWDAEEFKNLLPRLHFPDWPGYVVAYIPPPSPSGKCQQVTVKVDRRDSLVFARNEYCNVQDSAADSLAATKIEKRLMSEMTSTKKGKIPLAVAIFPPLASAGTSRVRIFLEFPQKLRMLGGRNCQFMTVNVDVLGTVYSKDETLVTRFSDRASLDDEDTNTFIPMPEGGLCAVPVPNQYETQLELAPGSTIFASRSATTASLARRKRASMLSAMTGNRWRSATLLS